ncbi:MAG: hypothetical protein M3280_03045 [Actinomycetota bacterium]|nr:hypothetical protein [Actinomycetota bacterium]
MRRRFRFRLIASTAVVLGACGGGTIANEDLPLGAIIAIAVVLIVALLYVAYIGGKDR